jgi:hypothetical protein
MIARFNINDRKKYPSLLDFIIDCNDEDFYLTKDNNRIYIENLQTLRELLRNSRDVYVLEENGEYQAICLLWKSCGGDKVRYYVKILARNTDATSDILRGFFWHIDVEVFLKVSKKHKFLDIFQKYGFKFIGGRGKQILLKRDKFVKEKKRELLEIREQKEELDY